MRFGSVARPRAGAGLVTRRETTAGEPSVCSTNAKGSLDCAGADEQPKSELPKCLGRIRLQAPGGQGRATFLL